MMRLVVGILLMAVCSLLSKPPVVPPAPRYDEIVCLAWVVWDESRGEPLRGSRAVYDVVLHRMVVRKKTACEVVKEPHQFSGYRPGARLKATNKMLTRYFEAAKMAPVVPNAEYFHATYVHPAWAKGLKSKTIGRHMFYQSPNKEKQK